VSVDFRSPRLFVRANLAPGASFEAEPAQANYLVNVLRLRAGDGLLVFNGRDGEWRATVEPSGRRGCRLAIVERTRAQTPLPDLHYFFAPLKQARLDYMVQKAVEMGAGRLSPVITAFTQVARVNRRRMEANVVEAAEQCGVLALPLVDDPVPLAALIADWDAGRRLIFCDEAAPVASPATALARLAPGPTAVLIGPEGGFSPEERAALLALPEVTALSLGPRIMRADTAAVAALALVQSFIGDWR
jgi:16S rRNA (uracil1498-N3)-methyltransferase